MDIKYTESVQYFINLIDNKKSLLLASATLFAFVTLVSINLFVYLPAFIVNERNPYVDAIVHLVVGIPLVIFYYRIIKAILLKLNARKCRDLLSVLEPIYIVILTRFKSNNVLSIYFDSQKKYLYEKGIIKPHQGTFTTDTNEFELTEVAKEYFKDVYTPKYISKSISAYLAALTSEEKYHLKQATKKYREYPRISCNDPVMSNSLSKFSSLGILIHDGSRHDDSGETVYYKIHPVFEEHICTYFENLQSVIDPEIQVKKSAST